MHVMQCIETMQRIECNQQNKIEIIVNQTQSLPCQAITGPECTWPNCSREVCKSFLFKSSVCSMHANYLTNICSIVSKYRCEKCNGSSLNPSPSTPSRQDVTVRRRLTTLLRESIEYFCLMAGCRLHILMNYHWILSSFSVYISFCLVNVEIHQIVADLEPI